MSAPRAPLALLATFLLATGTLLLVWDSHRPQYWGLLYGASAGVWVLALLASLPAADGPRELPGESVTALIATGGALLILLGVAVGEWLVLVGLGVLVGGLVGVVRDRRAAA